MEQEHEIMILPEVAAYLRCHVSTLYRLLKNGDLPGLRLGSDWRVRRQDVDAYLARSQTQPKL